MLLNGNSLYNTLLSMTTRPICVVLFLLMVASVCAPFILDARKVGKKAA